MENPQGIETRSSVQHDIAIHTRAHPTGGLPGCTTLPPPPTNPQNRNLKIKFCRYCIKSFKWHDFYNNFQNQILYMYIYIYIHTAWGSPPPKGKNSGCVPGNIHIYGTRNNKHQLMHKKIYIVPYGTFTLTCINATTVYQNYSPWRWPSRVETCRRLSRIKIIYIFWCISWCLLFRMIQCTDMRHIKSMEQYSPFCWSSVVNWLSTAHGMNINLFILIFFVHSGMRQIKVKLQYRLNSHVQLQCSTFCWNSNYYTFQNEDIIHCLQSVILVR
jgi:hypothetical protein